MTSLVTEPAESLSYDDIADCLYRMAHALLAMCEDILQIKAASQKMAEPTSRSHIIEESVREISQDELEMLFETSKQASPQPSDPEMTPIESAVPSKLSIKKEEVEQLRKLLMLVSSGGMQTGTAPASQCTTIFGEICDPADPKTIKEEPETPAFVIAEEVKSVPEDGAARVLRHLPEATSFTRSFQCDQCPKRFNNKFLLKKHQFIHTGAQPYKCDLCKRSFNRKDNMVRHRKTPHNMRAPFTSEPDPEPLPSLAASLPASPLEIQQLIDAVMYPNGGSSFSSPPATAASE